jgi:hypothetical protein
MGSGRFGKYISFGSWSFCFKIGSVLLHMHLNNTPLFNFWQHELICWDTIVLMKRSLKLLWGIADTHIALPEWMISCLIIYLLSIKNIRCSFSFSWHKNICLVFL